jgi:hypothetical protein
MNNVSVEIETYVLEISSIPVIGVDVVSYYTSLICIPLCKIDVSLYGQTGVYISDIFAACISVAPKQISERSGF